jgi:2-oxoglutarate ferredoxin oxidoreductase subunit alpha
VASHAAAAVCARKCVQIAVLLLKKIEKLSNRQAGARVPTEGLCQGLGEISKNMMAKEQILISGNDAIAKGAISAGCKFYAGYPITPQNEITAYMSEHMPKNGGVFIQAESELAAINMVFGASAVGERVMTSSSSPGISLKQEGISYMAGCELPGVIVNMMRGGPGLGNIAPAQSDYFQATKGGGHGDYHSIVLGPGSVQEAYDLMFKAFDMADIYRTPVIILGDGMLGQMMEPVQLIKAQSQKPKANSPKCASLPIKEWALTGCKGRKPNIIRSLLLKDGALEALNIKLQKKYQSIRKKEQRWESVFVNDAEIILIAYGTMARIAKEAVSKMRAAGKKVGLLRPISLWPFPDNAFAGKHPSRTKYLVVEMSYGQMVEDVRLALNGMSEVEFFGRAGGAMPTQEQIIKKIDQLNKG